MTPSDARSDYKTAVIGATDIVDLIGRTVKLTKRGKDYVGLCPFHQEKSPSFHVSPAKQFFYCYGCKAGGDAISFVKLRDRVEFPDALRTLGDAAGIPEPKYGGASAERAGEKQLLLDAHSAACGLFEKYLAHPEHGAKARAYLESRGFNAESIRKFQIGLAPEGWDNLARNPAVKKFPPDLLHRGGLLKKREKGDGYYDTFRNRLIFPIRDESGRVIAFGGRVLPGSDDKAKYLNSPETPLFFKGRSVFGLDLARQKIVESRTVVVVEGYTDVVMAHQFGATNVVSILGTAMTEQHVAVLRRFADRIVLLFDADTAGDTAVDRSVELFITQKDVEIAIASLPADVDPDEFFLREGLEAFEKLIAAAPDALTYKWKQLVRLYAAGSDNLTGQQKAIERYMEVLAGARASGPVDAIRWGAAVTRVSRMTGISIDELNKRFAGASKVAVRPGGAPTRAPAQNETSRAAPVAPVQRRGPLTAQDRVERQILGVLLLNPDRWQKLQAVVGVEDFTDPTCRRLAELYWEHQRDEGAPVFNEFLAQLGDASRGGHPALQEMAIASKDEVEALSAGEDDDDGKDGPDVERVLTDALGFLAEVRERRERQKLIADSRRTTDGPLPEQDEVDLIRQLQEKARRPDLRRA